MTDTIAGCPFGVKGYSPPIIADSKQDNKINNPAKRLGAAFFYGSANRQKAQLKRRSRSWI
jgi:hypothetical protein